MAKLTNKTKDFEITTVSQDFSSSNIPVNFNILPVFVKSNARYYHPFFHQCKPHHICNHFSSKMIKEWNNLTRSILDITDYQTFSNNLQQHLINSNTYILISVIFFLDTYQLCCQPG